MKKTITLLYLILHVLVARTQVQENFLPAKFILVIDGEVPVSGIVEGKLLVQSDSLATTDTITFWNRPGTFWVPYEKDYQKLLSLNKNQKMRMTFLQREFYPKRKECEYTIDIAAGWLWDEFLLIQITNHKVKRTKYFKYTIKNGRFTIAGDKIHKPN